MISLGGRIPQLDGLRGCAILLVLSHHYVASTIPHAESHSVLKWFSLGYSGVDLFFVLSGF
jgi:peptidoglycan/LPS O-acetylase OafA/YrhL